MVSVEGAKKKGEHSSESKGFERALPLQGDTQLQLTTSSPGLDCVHPWPGRPDPQDRCPPLCNVQAAGSPRRLQEVEEPKPPFRIQRRPSPTPWVSEERLAGLRAFRLTYGAEQEPSQSPDRRRIRSSQFLILNRKKGRKTKQQKQNKKRHRLPLSPPIKMEWEKCL